VILVISVWGFNQIWGLFSGGSDETAGQNTTNMIEVQEFSTLDEAKQFAEEHGLKFDKRFDPESTDEEKVTKQEPEPGAKIKKGQTLTVWVGSGGKPTPNYIGKFQSNVRGLPGVKVIYCRNIGDKGKIFAQDPKPNSPMKEGQEIKVWVDIINDYCAEPAPK
jgi:serine/threonine-protein kinase